MAVPASTMSKAIGPEPRSKAEPTAVGSAAEPELLDCRRREPPEALTRFASDRPSVPAFSSALAVCFEMGVEPVDPPLVGVPLVEWEPLVCFPPPPDDRHSV